MTPKTQAVRLLDVALLGPLLLWAASRPELGRARGAFALAGVGTMAYNAVNYGAIGPGREARTDLGPEGAALRVLDVVVLGPSMLWAAGQLRTAAPVRAALLGIGGALTVTNNAANLRG